MTAHWNHNDRIEAPYVMPRSDNPREFRSEMRPARVLGFTAPLWVVRRNWGWLGSVYVEFEDGHKQFCSLSPKMEA